MELGGRLEDEIIKSEKWSVEILEERIVLIGKFKLKAVVLNIEVCEENINEFLKDFRMKFSRGGG
ncbi:MAG: hypothetical protein SCJ93_01150 [Bacillota bacterium]|nr:hypothetical protein [Bacillota bacterium]